ncbi:hypothetical protein ACGILN_19015 [Serratia marcescens]|uniref:transketolase-like TK C-terminal-containing protein n=1 Tax=Serratia marcescens TaxID=615 RepID=UPI003748F24A
MTKTRVWPAFCRKNPIVGMTTFGESAPAEQLFAEFGFTVDNVVAKAQALLK